MGIQVSSQKDVSFGEYRSFYFAPNLLYKSDGHDWYKFLKNKENCNKTLAFNNYFFSENFAYIKQWFPLIW